MGKTLFVCAASALMVVSPSFGEDAYIENTNGNQYFNTGHFIGPHTRIEIDLQLLEIKGQIQPFGVYGAADATHPYCALYLGQAVTSGPWVWSYQASKSDYYSQAWNAKDCPADLERHKIVLDFHSSPKKFEVWTGDTKNLNRELANVSPSTQVYPLGLFAQCRHQYGMYSFSQNTFYNPAKMRLYSFRIYESGTLVKEFLPWVKGGIAGLKETQSGLFHSGENARACVAGGDVTIEKDDPYVSMPGNDVNQRNAVVGKTQYFETGYTFTPNSRLELDFAALTPDWTPSTKWSYETHVLFAAGNGFMLHLMPYGSNTNLWYYKIGTTEARIPGAGIDYAYNVRRKVSASASKMVMETAGYTNFTITSSSPITANLNSTKLQLGLRASNFPACPIKIYGLKIWETANGVETLVRDYRPCISNSVPRLVDVLNAGNKSIPTVYNNNSTNIVFDAGGDIKGDEAAKEAYLDFDGVNGHCINTEYVLTKDSRLEADFAIWNNNYQISGNEPPYFFEQRGYKDVAAECNGIWFRLYHAGGGVYGWQYRDYGQSFEWTTVPVSNERVKFTFDAPSNHATAYRGGALVWETNDMAHGGTLTATTCTSPLYIGGNWRGANSNAGAMRLYSVKIYNSGVLDRNFVPCMTNGVAGLYETCQNRFFPLAGGKVSGKGMKGEASDILVSPQPATLTHTEGENSTTLTCIAAGAQSYEWYEDGVLIPGETSDSLPLSWARAKAKMGSHTHTYSVVPVYTVFNETVKGDPVSAVVEMTPLGVLVIIK